MADIRNIENRINELSDKVVEIETKVSKMNKNNEFDYEKVLSAVKYLYRYYDDMNKDKEIEIRSMQR
jgi:predicted ATPase